MAETFERALEGITTTLAMRSPAKMVFPPVQQKPLLETDLGLRKVLADLSQRMRSLELIKMNLEKASKT